MRAEGGCRVEIQPVTPGSTVPRYPTTCENHPYPDSDPCGNPLLEDSISDDGIPLSKPLKPYIVADFHDYLANLLSRKDLESVMGHCCDDLLASMKRNEQPPTFVSDVFDAEFILTFEGPEAGKLFVDRPGQEQRYLFAINVDFFASEGMTLQMLLVGLLRQHASIYLPIFVINVNICTLLLSSLVQMNLI